MKTKTKRIRVRVTARPALDDSLGALLACIDSQRP